MSQYEKCTWEELEPLLNKEILPDDSTTIEEKQYMMDLILKKKPKVIVETGTHRGLTTCYLAFAGLEVGATVYTYDPYEWGAAGNFDKFDWLPIVYRQIRGQEMTQDKIDFAFIDGFHEKVEVLAELDVLLPKLNKGAPVLFHDVMGANIHCDVLGALDERGLKYKIIKTQNGIAQYEHKN